jgi:outer membrane protein assembly factor BamB
MKRYFLFSLFVLTLVCGMRFPATLCLAGANALPSEMTEDPNAGLKSDSKLTFEGPSVPPANQTSEVENVNEQTKPRGPQWPGFAYDQGRTGQSPYTGPQSNKLKWKFSLPSWGSSVAIGADGTAYVGTDAGVLFAFNEDGAEKWRFELPTVQVTPPDDWPGAEKEELTERGLKSSINDVAIGSEGTIYFGQALHLWKGSTTTGISVSGHERKLYALDPNGSVEWTFNVGERDIATHISIDPNDTIYFGTVKGQYEQAICHFYAVGPMGDQKWAVLLSSSGTLLSAALAPDGTIYVGGDKFRALNPVDGQVKWEYDIQTTTSIAAAPAVGLDGTVYICTRPGEREDSYKLFAVNPDGTKKWDLAVGVMETSPALSEDGTIYITSWVTENARAETGIKTGLTAITPDGQVKWSYETRFPDWHSNPEQRGKPWGSDSSPIVGADGTVYFGTDVGLVYAVNADGTLKWTFGIGGEFDNCPSMDAEGTLYICHSGGPGERFGGPLRCYAISDRGTATVTPPQSMSSKVRITRLEIELEKAKIIGNEQKVKEIQEQLDNLRASGQTPTGSDEKTEAEITEKIESLKKKLEEAKTQRNDEEVAEIEKLIEQLQNQIKHPIPAVRAIAIASTDARIKNALKEIEEIHVRVEYTGQQKIWRVNFYGSGLCVASASIDKDGNILQVEFPN